METSEQKNKYYTPKAEEFHVGFEYEVWSKVLVKDEQWGFKVNKMMFTIKHLTQTYFSFNLEQDLKEDKIRVKYLDREDIESLGFKLYTQGNVNPFTFRLFKDGDFQIHVSFGTPAIVSFSTRDGLESHFFNIKNKFEVRKLLVQLNILKDEK